MANSIKNNPADNWFPLQQINIPEERNSAVTVQITGDEKSAKRKLVINYSDENTVQKIQKTIPWMLGGEEKESSSISAESWFSKPLTNKVMPCTPSKIQSRHAFRQLYESYQKGNITFRNQRVDVSFFSTGSYFLVLDVTSKTELVPDVKNEKIVVKIFNDRLSRKGLRELESYLKTIKANYEEAVGAGLPVAKIYNIETLLEDRCIIQEKIPHQFNIASRTHLTQLRTFFINAVTHKLILDLDPGNLMVNEEEQVLLVDIAEDIERGQRVYFNHAIREWSRKGIEERGWDKGKTEQFIKWLTAPINVPEEDKAGILSELFPAEVNFLGQFEEK